MRRLLIFNRILLMIGFFVLVLCAATQEKKPPIKFDSTISISTANTVQAFEWNPITVRDSGAEGKPAKNEFKIACIVAGNETGWLQSNKPITCDFFRITVVRGKVQVEIAGEKP